MSSLNHLVEVRCNLCNSEEREIISRADIGNIVRCNICGLFYRNPRLSDEDEISKYRDHVYGDSHCPILHKARNEIYITGLKRIEPYKGRILDIGCSDGFFLKLAQQKGWTPYGIEISNFFLRKARENLGDKHVFDVPLRMVKFPSNSFDAITMWDVLDQLTDPWSELIEINRILKKGGLLVVRVRNMSFHLAADKLFKRTLWGIVRSPSTFHLYGFNNRNLKTMLKKAHFSKIKVENSRLTKGDPYSQLKFFRNFSINLIKKIYWVSSGLTGLLTFKNLLISPSIIAYAEKT